MILCANPLAQYKSHKKEILEAINRVLENGNYILGPEVAAFEKAFAQYCNVSHAIGLNSGTDALILTLRAMGVGTGDEVITVSHTALATISAVIASGATPVLVDISADYYTIDPVLIEKAITPKTKVIIAVHVYGQLADIDAIMLIAKKHNLLVIEDCAQSTGAMHKGRRAGSIADAGCFSFYPTKNLGAIGDGGMVVTKNDVFAERILRLRQYGWDRNRHTEEPGLNSRLDELQAAILHVKLKHLDADNIKRQKIAQSYKEGLTGLAIEIPAERPEANHVFHLYVIRSNKRNELKEKLAAAEIYAGLHYPVPGHLHGGYSELIKLPEAGLPVTEGILKNILSLPMYPEMTDLDIARVVSVIKECIMQNSIN